MSSHSRLTLGTRATAVTLIACVATLGVAYLLGFYLRFWTQHSGITSAFITLFDPKREASVPTGYSAVQLVVAGVLLLLIGFHTASAGGRHARHWKVLGVIFLYMAMDEVGQLHEWWALPGQWLLERLGVEAKGFLRMTWVLVGAVVAIAVGVAYLPFLWRLPVRTRVLMIASGVLFLGGALGVESFTGRLADVGADPRVKVLSGAVSEFGEITGIALFVFTLVDYMSRQGAVVTLGFGGAAEEAGRSRAGERASAPAAIAR